MAEAKVLSRLPIKGAVIASTGSGNSGYIPVLGADGKLDSSVVPGGSGVGSVTSVNVSIPNYTSSGAITTSGTIAMSANSQSANLVYGSPNGSAGTPAFRALLAADIPNLDAAKLTSGTLDIARIPSIPASKLTATGTADATTFYRGDGSWATPAGGGGTITSINVALPGFTSDGPKSDLNSVITLSPNIQFLNKFYATPATGADGPPSLRAITSTDIPSLPISILSTTGTASGITFLRGDGAWSAGPGSTTAVRYAISDIGSGVSELAVTFSAMPAASYYINYAVVNTVDSPLPSNVIVGSFYGVTTTGFTVVFAGPTPNANYKLRWYVSDVPSFVTFGSGGTVDPSTAKVRLSLSSTVPVTIFDLSAATSVYVHPYNGNSISLYNGSSWDSLSFSSPIAYSVSALSATTTYDIWARNVSGVVTIDSTAWDTNQLRHTGDTDDGLDRQNGIVVKRSDATRRYLGTIHTSGSGICEDSITRRFVWNYYNRKSRRIVCVFTAGSYNYTSSGGVANTWRPMGASTTVGQTRVETVVGLAEDLVKLQCHHASTGGNPEEASVGMGLDSTTVSFDDISGETHYASTATSLHAFGSIYPAQGFHYIQVLEKAIADNLMGNYASVKPGMVGEILS